MATDLAVYGPFDVPYDTDPGTGRGKNIAQEHADAFWQDAAQNLAGKEGCWIFGLEAARSVMPWYVGKTTDRFKDACLSSSKLTLYNKIMKKSPRGKPVLYFVAPRGSSRSVPAASVGDLWVFLAQYALRRNDKIKSVQSFKSVPEWSITGLVRSGAKVPGEVRKFKKMLDM